jgi:hypothetical protein
MTTNSLVRLLILGALATSLAAREAPAPLATPDPRPLPGPSPTPTPSPTGTPSPSPTPEPSPRTDDAELESGAPSGVVRAATRLIKTR